VRRLRAAIERRPVIDLAAESGDVVVNCTGLAARELAPDDNLYPLLGQVVITEPGTVDRTITITDDRDAERIFYVIPRRDELVLGGCSRPWPPGAPAEIDPAITARILDQARALGLAVGTVKTVRAGLRPYRLEVRLEREGRIIHNYGHGGAGYTLSRGCADEVARLI
jgi:D-amino-acid oxidase